MTVKELKEKLEQMPDDYIVLIDADPYNDFPYTEATCVTRGFNELDGYVLIDDYIEEENLLS